MCLWGDHGWHLGDHGLWCKHTNFENAVRVPLMVAGPGVKAAGAKSRALVEFVDIYPTLCQLAGLALPEHLEGSSFAPLLEEPERRWKTAALSQYPRGKVMGRSMRTDRHRLTLWQNRGGARQTVAAELYDHHTDPEENVNLALQPEHAPLVKRLSAELEQHWHAMHRPAGPAR